MTTLRQVRSSQRRVLMGLTLTLLILVGAHVSLEQAITGTWEWRTIATDGVTTVLVLLIAVIYMRSVARERRREVVEHMLLDLLAVPRNIRETADATVRALEQYELGDASLVAIDVDGDQPIHPVAARGYPREWIESAPALAPGLAPVSPTLQRAPTPHPWVDAANVRGRRRPWVAEVPILSDGDPIGVVHIITRRRRVLGDRAILESLMRHLSAAFDHAALYEAAYARERTLEELDSRRREFMAAIAHEIRTPLTAIQAFADLLQAGQTDMDETAKGLVTSLGQGVQRLSSLINDLIDLGRTGEVGYALRMEPVDLGAAVRAA